jgi:diguanylate cyclase (GGDEF)-like protein
MSRSAFMDDPRNDQRIERPPERAGLLPQVDGDGYRGLTTQMAWRTASVLFAVTAAACLLQAAGGLFGDTVANRITVDALGALMLVFSGIWWHLGTRAVDARWLHAVALMSYLLIAAVLRQAPSVEAHLGIAYLLPLIFAALYLPSRALVFYIALSVAFIAYSTFVHADGGFGLVPALMIAAALVTTASLTLYVRLQLDRIGRQAAFLSGRDALTGLANLRSLYERVDLMIRRAAREESGLTVLMIDLQGFKRVNDQHSHSVGDEMLRVAARALAESVRRDELVARRGGDEFTIVSDLSDERHIDALIDRLARAVARAREQLIPDSPSGVTVGYATYREGDSVGTLLARADHALNECKAATRIERWSWRARRLGEEFESGSAG